MHHTWDGTENRPLSEAWLQQDILTVRRPTQNGPLPSLCIWSICSDLLKLIVALLLARLCHHHTFLLQHTHVPCIILYTTTTLPLEAIPVYAIHDC